MPGGKDWELYLKLKSECNGQENDFGVGLFLTAENPKISNLNYNYEQFYPYYGFTN